MADFIVEQAQAALQGLFEAVFLQLEGLADQGLGARQFAEGLAHLAHQGRHQPPHQRIPAAHHVGVAHGPAHDATQHIAAAFVRGQHAVGDQKTDGAQVIGDDPVGDGMRAVRGLVAGLGRGRDQGLHQVGVVIVVFALQQRGEALQAHAGIDRGFGQRDALLGAELLELHEHQVPDFDEAVAVFLGTARRPARDMVAVVVEDLRTGPAGPGLAHAPEVVRGGDADDALVGESGDFFPQLEGLVVVMVDGDQQAFGVEAVLPGEQAPGQLDGFVLEIVAEGKVAQHLEKGVVAGGIADIVEIVVFAAGAQALLAGHGARIVALFGAGENVLELHHAGVGKEQRRIVVRHQRTGRDDLVAVGREVVEKSLANVVGGLHVPFPLDTKNHRNRRRLGDDATSQCF